MKTLEVNSPPSLPDFAFRLRVLVLALGESASPAWWKTEFMNETGLRFLERLYPRTSLHAAVHAAGKAACDAHDRAVGRVGAYHLFRLPESLEAEIYRIPPHADEIFPATFRAAQGHADKLVAVLASLCGRASGEGASSGAKLIGTDRDLMSVAAFEEMAVAYHNSFKYGKQVFPYFTVEHSGSRSW